MPAQQQRVEWIMLGVMLLVTIYLLCQLLPMVIIYAPSASLRKGWYVRDLSVRALAIGDIIVLAIPRAMVVHVPLNVPATRLLKHVAALAGDTVCWEPQAMVVTSRHGRVEYPTYLVPMIEGYQGCQTMTADDLVIVGTHPRSMDSRYIGPVPASLFQFRVRPLWTWEAA